jgi:hypothetical protein
MAAKVTLSFSEETIEQARACARREGVSLSTWIDRAAHERALRDVFNAHADALHRAGLDAERDALADEDEIAAVDAATLRASRAAG